MRDGIPTDLLDRVAQQLPQLIRWRRDLHAHPETGVHNPRTQQAVLQALDGLDLEVAQGRTCSSVTATLRGSRPGPTILLRADTDALPMTEDTGLDFASQTPGAAHACGHDMHTAMLLGAATLLATDLREKVAGTVKFVFQPGEEGCGGAERMLDDGLLDEPADAAFALHVNPNLPSGVIATKPGSFFASCDEFEITLTGRGGHASMPHTCNDPIPALLTLGTSLLSTVSRSFDPADPVLVSLGAVTAGTTTNVIPESGALKGTLRAYTPASRAQAWARITRLAESTAEAHGLTCRITHSYGCAPTINTPDAAQRILHLAADLLGPERSVELSSPVMAAEDFGYVLERVPGALVLLGACPPGTSPTEAAPCHSNRMTLDEHAMITGTALHLAVALTGLHPRA
ncbi:M20 metallopeptidase family protein [Streptomyces yunnanensis]|uniref:Hippurate hydrolase n=1 Tax=Streptomyces yunnanensis TaxID=156453 RepID=A0A9X8QXS4_9ACTN|nr:M20 family metallopeptidase [Streptomyces yunnanensis]SHM90710.1 hippurate hydrolase [Streptomyces yunnanensis]